MKRRVIAVTGGIGSGKSAVGDILRKRGYATVDCDALAREVSVRPETVERVAELLGKQYVTDGKLNRQAVRNRVFADKELLSRYNAIFFGEVKLLLDERIREIDGTVFVEIPVFDAFEYAWDAVWLVESNTEDRIKRTQARDGASRRNVEDIVNSQRVCQEYTCKISNCGTLDGLEEEVDKALLSLQ